MTPYNPNAMTRKTQTDVMPREVRDIEAIGFISESEEENND